MGVINSYRFKTAGQKRLLFDVFPFDVAINRLRSTREAWFYSTLSGAVNDVNAGTIGTNENADEASAVACVFFEDGKPVVGLLKDTTERKRITLSADMTINLGGKTVTFGNDYFGIRGTTNAEINVTIDGRIKGSSVILNGIDGGGVTIKAYAGNHFTIIGGKYVVNETVVNTKYSGVAIGCADGGFLTVKNCKAVANCAYYATAIDNRGTADVFGCDITATTASMLSRGVLNTATATLSYCKIQAYSDYLSDGADYVEYSQGVKSADSALLTINNCYVLGTHCGLANDGTLYINGGTFESYGHGGIYFSGEGTTSYVRNATLSDMLTMPEGWEGTSQHNGSAFYIGGADNISVYMDNCDLYGSIHQGVLRGSSGEKNNSLYISNSRCHDLDGDDISIRIDNNTHKLYLGRGNNFTAKDTTLPEAVIVTDEVYVQGGGS